MEGISSAAAAVIILNGLVTASMLFIVASGVSIIFGVTRIANFAHGSFYMIGAYVGYSIFTSMPPSLGGFLLSILGAGVAIGLLGTLVEMAILRRIYRAPEAMQLVATFALVLIAQDVVQAVWGPEEHLGPRVPALRGAVVVFGQRFPEYNLLIILVAPLLLGLLYLIFNYTRWGVLIRAATQDREMVEALGVNQKWLFTSVFALGSVLAGVAGALQVPREGANLGMDLNMVIEAFVVVVIGGMGSLLGCFLASLVVGIMLSLGALFIPKAAIVVVFALMAVMLVVRPHGLLGKPDFAMRHTGASNNHLLKALSPRQWRFLGVALLLAAMLPLVVGNFGLVVSTEILIYALFGCSLYFLIGPGGMPSFGHAAYFGIGAYAAALMQQHGGENFLLSLVAAPVAGAIAALCFGWFCVRLSGVYLAMLTLAFAQIVWAVVYSWNSVTGGENGIVGLTAASWASSQVAYYYLTLLVVTISIMAIYWITLSPFGYIVRAGRDAPVRTEAIGIDVRQQQWFAFIVSAAFAGLAGGLLVFLKNGVFPLVASVSMSIDVIVVTLVGGLQSLFGPILGAVVYQSLKTWIQLSTDQWRAVIGGVIIAIVLLLPGGLSALVRSFAARKSQG